MLVKVDPVGDPLCPRQDCFMCKTAEKDKGKCRLTNIVYKIECRECSLTGSKVQYWGETSRSGYERSAEHKKDLEHMRGGHMETHLAEKHPNICLKDPKNREAETNFKIQVHKRYKSAMDRQLGQIMKDYDRL